MFGQAWLMMEFNRESDRGYERTTNYKGFPAYEKFDHHDEYMRAELTIVVSQRFIVNLKSNNPSGCNLALLGRKSGVSQTLRVGRGTPRTSEVFGESKSAVSLSDATNEVNDGI